ncbi:hypothetical protein GCM10011579_051280 [Streptomyces albiflavescens]|uniref:Uncharacterized protein n=1 Tax=Streptomyces albiflavescens TaxID=1623582 RepID=A0A918D6N6_9ACTN|nr:DUF6082 family protein [Streptomyces albiflavescens]GGN73281.1 hypothetical protein GCM10011579_051280 [Streptomyces albiflavescens]
MNERFRQFGVTVGAVLIACFGCAALSVLLVQIPALQSDSSSNAGQAFGAASAASSTAVLFYMARTMRMQKKESELQRLALQSQLEALEAQCHVAGLSKGELHRTSEALIRGLHMSILKMAMDDPELAATWPSFGRDESASRNRQFLYMNQVLSLQMLAFEMGYTERHVEASLRSLFVNPLWREFWESRRPSRAQNIPPDTLEGEFSRIVERAYEAAVGATPLRRHG